MTTNERAAQIWSVLALAAHNRQVLTYEMVARLTGSPESVSASASNPSSPIDS